MKLYTIKPLVWVDSLDKTIATANDSGGLRYTATASGVALYDGGEYMWSAKCKSLARGKQLAEELRLERIELNLEEVDQEPLEELLREAAATVHASLVEPDISDARREYRRGLEQRLLRAGKAKGGAQ